MLDFQWTKIGIRVVTTRKEPITKLLQEEKVVQKWKNP
jgi:hypothetical protein